MQIAAPTWLHCVCLSVGYTTATPIPKFGAINLLLFNHFCYVAWYALCDLINAKGHPCKLRVWISTRNIKLHHNIIYTIVKLKWFCFLLTQISFCTNISIMLDLDLMLLFWSLEICQEDLKWSPYSFLWQKYNM